jgi:hypothetical protein
MGAGRPPVRLRTARPDVFDPELDPTSVDAAAVLGRLLSEFDVAVVDPGK